MSLWLLFILVDLNKDFLLVFYYFVREVTMDSSWGLLVFVDTMNSLEVCMKLPREASSFSAQVVVDRGPEIWVDEPPRKIGLVRRAVYMVTMCLSNVEAYWHPIYSSQD